LDHVLTHNPSLYNNYFDSVYTGIDTRKGAQVLVENNVFYSSHKPLFSTDSGYAVATGNDFGGASNEALAGSLTSVPYNYSLSSISSLKSAIPSTAGAALYF
jgi:pectate lyase